MMKRRTLFLLALSMTVGLLAACGSKTDESGAADTDVDLEALYNG